jgi:hypothetical protein
MWEPRRLTTLWAFTACYRDSFTFIVILIFEELSRLGWNDYVVKQNLIIQGNVSAPFSGSESKLACVGFLAYSLTLKKEQYVPLGCQAISELHSITTQDTIVFIVTIVRNSNPAV